MGIYYDIRFIAICIRALLQGGMIKNFCIIYALGGNVIPTRNIVRRSIIRFAIGSIIMTYLNTFFKPDTMKYLIICKMIIPSIRIIIHISKFMIRFTNIIKNIFYYIIYILLASTLYIIIIFMIYHSRYFIKMLMIEIENEYNLYSSVVNNIFNYKYNSLKGLFIDTINYLYRYVNGQIYYSVNYLHDLYSEPVFEE